MSIAVRRTSMCHRDLVEIADYFDRTSSERAERFLRAVDDLCDTLVRTPDLGTRIYVDKPHFSGLRAVTIPGFRSYLVCHRPVSGDIEIVRVIHASRDIDAALEESP